jgi:hypothetical protein
LKLRGDGTTEWQKAYEYGMYGRDVLETSSGDFIISGRDSSHVSLLSIDRFGEFLWSKRYGTAIHYAVYGGYSLSPAADGGYILAGTDELNVLKFSGVGSVEWGYSYGGGVAESAIATSDGGYLVSGSRWLSGPPILIKLNGDGSVKWQRSYKKEDITFETNSSVEETSDGGYVMAGRATTMTSELSGYEWRYGAWSPILSHTWNDDGWVIKTDRDGQCPPLDTEISPTATPLDLTSQDMQLSVMVTDFQEKNTNIIVQDTHALVLQQTP